MTGLLLSLATAGLFGANATCAKRLSDRGARGGEIALANFGVAAVLLGGAAAWSGVPRLGPDFLPCLAGTILLAALGFPLYFGAIARTDLSIAVPLASLSPVFQLGTGWLILNERPTALGAVGVVVVTAGAYLLGIEPESRRPLDPIRALARDPGARRAIAVALLWAAGAPIDKRGVLASSPLFYMAAAQPPIALLLFLVARARGRSVLARTDTTVVLASGATHAGMSLAQGSAYQYLPAAYVAAIKRVGILVSVAEGIRRGERVGPARAAAVALLVGGVVLVAIS